LTPSRRRSSAARRHVSVAQLLSIGPDGSVRAGAAWERAEAAWYAGAACMARAGLGVIIEEVLLGGEGQRRLSARLDGQSVLWVGVRCDPAVAAVREAARGDRIAGMAATQARVVHDGVRYDLVLDTSTTPTEECARALLTHLRGW
jgi:chloramphenicol 3-O phosphotransferase